MRNNKFLKSILVLLVVVQAAGLPLLASAQLGDVPVSDSALGTGGIVGTTLNATANGLMAAVDVANKACLETENVYFKSDKAVSFGLGGLSLISGGSSVIGQLTSKINAIEGFKTCHNTQLTAAKAVTTPNTFTAQRKQLLVDEITKEIASLQAREEPLNNQLKVAQQGFWKTLVYNILIKTTKTVAINMVNKLSATFKINDYKKYADAVATQVYDNQYIMDNFSGSKADQMLARSMLSNPVLQSELSPAVFQRADLALGFDPAQMDVSDPNYYQKVFYVGSGGTNPFMTQATFSDAAQTAHYKSLVTAQAELSQSAGLKTPRDCKGTMAQQQALDKSYEAVNKRVQDRQTLLNNLNNAKTLGQPVSASDLTKAQNDLAAAQKDWQALPNSGNDVLVSICEGIVSPPSLINKGIDQAFNAIGQNIGTYNENNLPFFINFISDVANSVTNQLVFAGGISGSKLLNENIGNLTKAASVLTTGATANSTVQQSKNLVVDSSRTDDGSNSKLATYQLDWDANGVANATGVAITGPNLPASISGFINSSLSGSATVNVPIPGTYSYTVTAYGKSKADVLATVKINVVVSVPTGSSNSLVCQGKYDSLQACLDDGQGADICNQLCGTTVASAGTSQTGTVAGAFTSAAATNPRGAALHPRGE